MRRPFYISLVVSFFIAVSLFSAITTADRVTSRRIAGRPATVRVEGAHTIDVTSWGPDQAAIDLATSRSIKHPAVQKYLKRAQYRILSFEYIDEDTKATPDVLPPRRYRVVIFDYTGNRAIEVKGSFEGDDMEVAELATPPDPNEEEFNAAVKILSAKDAKVREAINNRTVEVYPPMPPLVNSKGERTVGVGLKYRDGSEGHEIVGVNMIKQTVAHFPNQAPEASMAAPLACGPPSSGQGGTSKGLAGQSEIVISRQGTEVWRFTVIRPSASSGTRGSSIEVINVDYRGKRVLRRMHTPILNVQYDRNRCGPYRDWSYSENMFMANGTDVATAIRVCSTPPTTIIDTGVDTGNFRGVAIYDNREEVTLVTELDAGWYRYLAEYTFQDNGTIRPRYAFGATTSTCVCNDHNHHVYWRFDFDIRTPENNFIVENRNGAISQHSKELKLARLFGQDHTWTIQNSVTGESATIVPGPRDGNYNKYGRLDVALLRFNNGQIDDGVNCTQGCATEININPFINDESVMNEDVVVWYGVHFEHFDDLNTLSGPHVFGPNIVLQKY
jgi:hypothetical protein